VLLHAAEMVVGISALPARRLDITNRPCVISLTNFRSGKPKGATNILPDSAEMSGTIRSYEPMEKPGDSEPSVRQIIESYVQKEAGAHGLTATCSFTPGAPPLVNDPALAESIATRLNRDWKEGKVGPSERTMAAEDFAFYTPECACVFLTLGIAKGDLGKVGAHQVKFTVHPDALPIGVRLLLHLAFYNNARTS
jgi:N-acetylcysteine deacetylase